jgi:hypothetical protein
MMLVPAPLLEEQGVVFAFARGYTHPLLVGVHEFEFV